MKAKQRILRHLRRYKAMTVVTYQGWGLSNLHARITELIGMGHNISRDEKLKIYSRGKFMKQYTKYRLVKSEDIYSDYDKDEDGNLISCCGDILDPDVMICPTCKEHN